MPAKLATFASNFKNDVRHAFLLYARLALVGSLCGIFISAFLAVWPDQTLVATLIALICALLAVAHATAPATLKSIWALCSSPFRSQAAPLDIANALLTYLAYEVHSLSRTLDRLSKLADEFIARQAPSNSKSGYIQASFESLEKQVSGIRLVSRLLQLEPNVLPDLCREVNLVRQEAERLSQMADQLVSRQASSNCEFDASEALMQLSAMQGREIPLVIAHLESLITNVQLHLVMASRGTGRLPAHYARLLEALTESEPKLGELGAVNLSSAIQRSLHKT